MAIHQNCVWMGWSPANFQSMTTFEVRLENCDKKITWRWGQENGKIRGIVKDGRGWIKCTPFPMNTSALCTTYISSACATFASLEVGECQTALKDDALSRWEVVLGDGQVRVGGMLRVFILPSGHYLIHLTLPTSESWAWDGIATSRDFQLGWEEMEVICFFLLKKTQ